MISATDLQAIRDVVVNMEQALIALKRVLEQIQPVESTETAKPGTSLYGVFAPTDVVWEDFQKAKRAWLKDMGEI